MTEDAADDLKSRQNCSLFASFSCADTKPRAVHDDKQTYDNRYSRMELDDDSHNSNIL
jgi:hypothetical protein